MYIVLSTPVPCSALICFTELDVSYQNVNHALIFVILITYINTKLLKNCSESRKLLKVARIEKVAQNAKSCLKVAEHNLFTPSGAST